MSEATWTVREGHVDPPQYLMQRIDGPDGAVLYVDGLDGLAERIARLLAEEDERIEREMMRERFLAEAWKLGLTIWCAGPSALVKWGEAQQERRRLSELRTLEAAYRAAVAQEQP